MDLTSLNDRAKSQQIKRLTGRVSVYNIQRPFLSVCDLHISFLSCKIFKGLFCQCKTFKSLFPVSLHSSNELSVSVTHSKAFSVNVRPSKACAISVRPLKAFADSVTHATAFYVNAWPWNAFPEVKPLYRTKQMMLTLCSDGMLYRAPPAVRRALCERVGAQPRLKCLLNPTRRAYCAKICAVRFFVNIMCYFRCSSFYSLTWNEPNRHKKYRALLSNRQIQYTVKWPPDRRISRVQWLSHFHADSAVSFPEFGA